MNNQAIIAAVESIIEIPGADKIQIAVVLGEQCVVGKDIGVGYVGVLFPEGLQLSEEYCHQNNLFRKAEKNKDSTKTGFFEESRRVRAQPFLKVRSTAYFATLESLAFAGNGGTMTIGTQFDEINGHKICQKYYSPQTLKAMGNKATKAKKVINVPFFEKHVDSEQFKHMAHTIPTGSLIHIHNKIHGTSARMAHTIVNITLPKWKQWVNKMLPVFPTQKWDYVVGTRNVVLDTPTKEGFHGSEGFRFKVLAALAPHMPKGMTVYGEIAGFANGAPIMARHDAKATKNKDFVKKYGETITYKYRCKETEYRFHVYRITMLGHDGVNRDFTQAQIDRWCKDHGALAPYEVYKPFVYDGDTQALTELVERLTERPECFGADYVDPSHPGEGIILRVDNGNDVPKFYKSKSYFFRVLEGHCEAEDAESTA